jgi:hypothetical protein
MAAWGDLGRVGGFDAGLASALRFGFLLLSASFLGLKVVDVPWLRLKPGWRTTVTSLVLIGLLHAAALERIADTRIAYTPSHVGMVLFVSGLLATQASLLPDLIRLRSRASAVGPYGILIPAARGPRAPPLS